MNENLYIIGGNRWINIRDELQEEMVEDFDGAEQRFELKTDYTEVI